jgi:hypothetical protein
MCPPPSTYFSRASRQIDKSFVSQLRRGVQIAVQQERMRFPHVFSRHEPTHGVSGWRVRSLRNLE